MVDTTDVSAQVTSCKRSRAIAPPSIGCSILIFSQKQKFFGNALVEIENVLLTIRTAHKTWRLYLGIKQFEAFKIPCKMLYVSTKFSSQSFLSHMICFILQR